MDGKRKRVHTEKGRAFEEANKIKNEKAKERAKKKVNSAETQEEIDDLSELFKKVGVDTTEDELLANLQAMRLGGRRRKTRKHKSNRKRKYTRRV